MKKILLLLRSIQRPLSSLWRARNIVIAIPYFWLLLFFLLPFLIVFKMSIVEPSALGNPFVDLANYSEGVIRIAINLGNYLFISQDSLYLLTYLRSIKFAALTTIICLIIGYPFAYFIARAKASIRPILLVLIMLPFWTSFLLRIYAWKGILDSDGILNNALLALGWINTPLQLMYTPLSLTIGMVYAYLPFMVLPLFAHLVKLDTRLLEAAADLGANPWTVFWKITVPLSKSGIIAGSMLVFIPCVGEFVIPELLGGPETLMIGRTLWDEFFSNNDWPMAAAITVIVILLILLPMAFLNRYQSQQLEHH